MKNKKITMISKKVFVELRAEFCFFLSPKLRDYLGSKEKYEVEFLKGFKGAGTYRIHITKDPKGKYPIWKVDGAIYYGWLNTCCSRSFILLFGKEFYNSISESAERYNIEFKPV